jgi:hypothetical protein
MHETNKVMKKPGPPTVHCNLQKNPNSSELFLILLCFNIISWHDVALEYNYPAMAMEMEPTKTPSKMITYIKSKYDATVWMEKKLLGQGQKKQNPSTGSELKNKSISPS